ncbi:hypothetical protein ONZ51_g8409 [Trametes cubensis]|uniref:Uncharacterized protein n=1 Tax=Trametes cubensis TaxID=1111947 RepID=A0AAD7TPG8_9APHY|nr:hypothetical protein ONZ51_g8409 [Trametes cubensis]
MTSKDTMAYQSCQVVPGEDELPCVQRGYGERPRLCNVHRQEYTRLTASYKARAEEADKLYEEVCGKDWEDRSLWNMRALTDALGAAARCQNAIEEEILGRRRHHDRFFADRFALAGDGGHQAWIRRRQEKAREVEAIAKQLRVCKTKLAEEQTQKAAARRREEEAAIWERASLYTPTDRQATSRYSDLRDDPLEPESYQTRMICMVLQPGSKTMRCKRVVAWGETICQQHSEELSIATHKLMLQRARKRVHLQDDIDWVSWRVSTRAQYDLHTLNEDIATVIEFKELLSSIDALTAEIDRLSTEAPESPSQADDYAQADDLLRQLRTIRTKPPRAQARSSHAPPPRGDDAFGEGGSWVSTVLMAVGTAAAVWFGFRR